MPGSRTVTFRREVSANPSQEPQPAVMQRPGGAQGAADRQRGPVAVEPPYPGDRHPEMLVGQPLGEPGRLRPGPAQPGTDPGRRVWPVAPAVDHRADGGLRDDVARPARI